MMLPLASHDDCHFEMKSDNQFDHDFQDEGSVYFCKLQKCAKVMADGQKWTYLFSYNHSLKCL